MGWDKTGDSDWPGGRDRQWTVVAGGGDSLEQETQWLTSPKKRKTSLSQLISL